MKIRDKLYLATNMKKYRTINIDDDLYEKIQKLAHTKYDASISEIINISIEEYIDRNHPNYYPKKDGISVTYREISLRSQNIDEMKKFSKETGISFTRLVNSAIKEFVDSIK